MSDFVDARIPDGFKAAPSVPSLRTAGTDEAEADAPDTVAADSAVVDAERDPSYRDRVEHRCDCLSRNLSALVSDPPHLQGHAASCFVRTAELERVGRLSRWQETRG